MQFIFFIAAYIVLCFGFVSKTVDNKLILCLLLNSACTGSNFSFSHSTCPHLPRRLKVVKLGSSTAGTVESAKGIFLPYNVIVLNRNLFCILHSRRTAEEEGDEGVSYSQGAYCLETGWGSVYWWEEVCDFF